MTQKGLICCKTTNQQKSFSELLNKIKKENSHCYLEWFGSPAIYKQYWTSPGGNIPQGTNYTATCLPSRKLSKLDEPDMQDTAGEARMSRIWDVALKTYQRWWSIGRSGERGSGISMPAARQDDDDDDDHSKVLMHFM